MSGYRYEFPIFEKEMEKDEFTILLGKKIREIRTELGITQKELAGRCFKDKQHIQLIESGKVTPNSYNLYLIAKSLNTDVNVLFSSIERLDK